MVDLHQRKFINQVLKFPKLVILIESIIFLTLDQIPGVTTSEFAKEISCLYGKTIVALCTPKIHEATNHRFITTFAKCLASCNARLLVYLHSV